MRTDGKVETLRKKRRDLLQVGGLLVAFPLAGCLGDDNDDPPDDDPPDDDPPDDDPPDDDPPDDDPPDDDVHIQLGGQMSGWVGQYPDDITDEMNPTLELVEGQEYILKWENLDGIGHNFAIENADGENPIETSVITDSGSTQTVEFIAEADMVAYYCTPHPFDMRGEINIVE